MIKLAPVTKFPCVCADSQRRTCLAIVGGTTVEFIPLSIENGFNVESMPAKAFGEIYKEIVGYPPERCAALFGQYAMTVGASPEALEHLGRFTKLTPKEIEMATAKKASATKAEKNEKPAKAAAKPAKVVAAKTAEPKAKGPSAAQMFKDLIMKGTLSDDKIFEKVKEKFGLDDKKRSYVAWYRKDLAKKGMNPPDAK